MFKTGRMRGKYIPDGWRILFLAKREWKHNEIGDKRPHIHHLMAQLRRKNKQDFSPQPRAQCLIRRIFHIKKGEGEHKLMQTFQL